ncbi:MAG: 50S ribosomal protein L15 [Okeania sp. SIO3I5]|uniref:50S ribosomal protein L15 n=1 Tax=Okeania sp. SIO3I5 TaxID=2607805 RepID=UPI0013B5C4E3|nr:50S ribosomal protein L15 [Okeania sp. SIO3I5]NEQ38869.1 50S ribosomal protein L15 [Okeania sp. SIO3I5]
MRLKDAIPKKGSQQRGRRVGRGISAGQGASCGKGMRGQKSRSGSSTRPGFEGGQNPLYRRLPKLKSFPMVNRKQYTIINVSKLSSLPANTQVTLTSLMELGIITTNDGPLKILGDGELNVALKVCAAAFTASARSKIEAAGGSCEQIGTAKTTISNEDSTEGQDN